MMTHIYRYIAAASLGFALCAAPVNAASEGEEAAPAESAEKSEHGDKKAPEKRASQKKPSRFETCRRDARGFSGPERARFMTECLHERL